MNEPGPTVFIVDDDPSVRASMDMLMESAGLPHRAFPSAREFLGSWDGAPGCLVLDVRMPGMTGIELQEELDRRGTTLPIVFLTAYADVPMAVGAVRAGAVDFLQKPVNAEHLLERVRDALAQDTVERQRRCETDAARHRLAHLTAREAEVLELLVAGQTNKAIAKAMGLSRRTVETHRARIMRKTGSGSLPELVRTVGLARRP